MCKNSSSQESLACAFTGSRPMAFHFKYNENHHDCQNLKKRITLEIHVLYLDGFRTFYCGAAMGVDMWCGEIVLHLKKVYSDIKLISVVPFIGQEKTWPKDYQERYHHLLENSDKTIILHDKFANKHYMERNRYIVDRSDLILAVCAPGTLESRTGGTYYTVNYANKMGKDIEFVFV